MAVDKSSNASGLLAIAGIIAAWFGLGWPVWVFRRHWTTTQLVNCATYSEPWNVNGCSTTLNAGSGWTGQGIVSTPHSAISNVGWCVEIALIIAVLAAVLLIGKAYRRNKVRRPASVAFPGHGSPSISSTTGLASTSAFQTLQPLGERNTRAIPQDVKIAVTVRDQGKCRQCGSADDLHFDHVIPWSKGGANTVNNIQLLCGRCNRRKGARW